MPRYGLIWLEIAYADYNSLPAPVRAQIDTRIEQLLEQPHQPHDSYDPGSDHWTTIYDPELTDLPALRPHWGLRGHQRR